jgi:hypothetical protein
MKIRTLTALGAALLVAAPAAATVASAQQGSQEPLRPGVSFYQGEGLKQATFIATEMAFDGQVVKEAPYSAEATSESIQTLADGNRIVRSSTSSIFRDGEGRTRREQTLKVIGPWAAATGSSPVIIINDPVLGVSAILNPEKRTARKLPAPSVFVTSTGGSGSNKVIVERELQAARAHARAAGVRARATGTAAQVQAEKAAVEVVVAGGGPSTAVTSGNVYFIGSPEAEGGVRVHAATNEDAKTESLGKRSFEGVEAEGSRTTVTIPAGEIGNERDIEIVSERWYSPQLKTVVYTRHADPRFGETIYKLTNINLGEPDASLFTIPGDFKIEETGLPGSFVFTAKPAEKKVVRKP